MDVAVLGPLRVRVGGDFTAIAAPKQRLIFGVLLDQAGRVVSGDRLLDDVWSGQPPQGGLKALRYHVSKLRDVLVPGRVHGDEGPIRTAGSGYQLVVEPDEIDANRFERLASDGAQLVANQQWEDARRVLGEALSLWRGDALHDFRYEEFAQAPIARLEELRLVCLEDLIDARLGLGDHIDLIGELNELTTRHPLRERLWAQSMIALYRAGRQAEAAHTYETACVVLGEELGVEPNPALRHLLQQVIDQSLPFRPKDERAAALPHRSSSFVGRTSELEDVARLVTSRRLVTVVGPGGVGKTSVAIEAARGASQTTEGLSFVDLAVISKSSDVVAHIARACGVVAATGRATIEDTIEHLDRGSHLLVIDNCEHVAPAVASAITALLLSCPNVTVLATSRQPLHIDGEHLYPVHPLPFDEHDEFDSDAVRLFADRAAAACGHFLVDERNRAVVVETCRRLDGLPLALELAAARLRVLSVDELYERLDQRFELLVDDHAAHERHRALLATVNWSHELLSREAQTLLRRLSVLRGRFDLEAVVGVFTDLCRNADVLDLVSELVETSFLTKSNQPEGGFTMLETIREFASQQLEHSGESADVFERHARYFAGRAAQRPVIGSRQELIHMRRWHADSENHTAALDWSLQHGEPDLTIRLGAGLALHWYTAARGDEALRWLLASLDAGERAASPERAEALCSLGQALPWIGRHEEAAAVADEMDRIAAQLHMPEIEADALDVRAVRALVAGDISGSRRLIDLAVVVLRSAESTKVTVFLWQLAYLELLLGNADRSAALVDELELLGTQWDQPLTTGRVALLRGQIAYFAGDLGLAFSEMTSSLSEIRRLGLIGPQAPPLRSLCGMAVTAERWDLAESTAREFVTLATSTGEIAALPHGHNALAAVSLARGEFDQASRHVADGLAVIRRTRSAVTLDDTLLAAARVATAHGRPQAAATLHAARERRHRMLGLIDPVPVARLIDREVKQLRADGYVPTTRELTDRDDLLDMAQAAVQPRAVRG
jgi:predicted ATPase/DNA-binding SARP family transcriptional activator